MASNILECGSKDRGKKWRIRASRSSPAERSLRSSGCLQTLITSANGGPFLNRDDANIYIYIDACRHLIPGRRRRRRRVVQLSLSSPSSPSSPPPFITNDYRKGKRIYHCYYISSNAQTSHSIYTFISFRLKIVV